ncbi:MAG: acetoacetate--CoA ligase [Bacteroidales bacterium]|nr:acetoacetate--CoA ligase [Bacteroidales bacterium]
MTGRILWNPRKEWIANSRMHAFMTGVCSAYGLGNIDYQEFHKWSVEYIPEFWKEVWDFCGIIHSEGYHRVVDDAAKMPGAVWFEGVKLNFAGNLLRRNDDAPALIFRGETLVKKVITYSQLHEEVRKVAAGMKRLGLQKGDRIAAIMPNMPETVIAMLAAASLGAIWSSASPDFGIKAISDRFAQIEPRIIIATDGYYYKGKYFNVQEKLRGIICDLPSVERMVIVDYTGHRDLNACSNTMSWEELASPCDDPLIFEQLPFDHPVYILYSSGTTGLPKSIVHSAGGTLIQHLKELELHCNIRKDDKVFYFTTCGWMMWNWFVSSLAIGATLVLYDGNPFYPTPDILLRMADELDISFFGTSAKYIASLESEGVVPDRISSFPHLRVIASTGSPLSEESFEFVYRDWKKDVQLSSISGGTDIISCFFLGNPLLPVRSGEIQGIGLGMDVDCFDGEGKPLRGEKGELVCKSAFPSMPVSFWNDPGDIQFREAYFNVYPGVWRHGDYISIHSGGGVTIYGRSDATLNPQGVRIGTAEIYRVVESMPEIEDSIVTGKIEQGDEMVVLFVRLKEGFLFTPELEKSIRGNIRNGCSPRHVPSVIREVSEIPYTLNGKKVEIAVKQAINGEEVKNTGSLANPQSLDIYRQIFDNQ